MAHFIYLAIRRLPILWEEIGRCVIDNRSMNASKPRILVVDDDPKYMNSMTAILKAGGYGTLSASNGERAVEIAKLEKPVLTLLDVCMPVLDGYEAAC